MRSGARSRREQSYFASPEEFISIGNITKQFIHAFSCASVGQLCISASVGKIREHTRNYSCSRLGFEQPMRSSCALQTSRAS